MTDKPVWVSEVGVSTFGAEEVQEWGFAAEPRICWWGWRRLHPLVTAYTISRRLGRQRPGTGRPKVLPITGTSIWACSTSTATRNAPLARSTRWRRQWGICQWVHFEDHRLDDTVRWLREFGVTHLRTGLSWADSFRPDADRWFDRQMAALEPFQVTVTFCFTPEHRGTWPHYTAVPQIPAEFADFCARMVRRYG